jgi:hypothetical protein
MQVAASSSLSNAGSRNSRKRSVCAIRACCICWVIWTQSEFAQAQPYLEQSLEGFRLNHDLTGQGEALVALANSALMNNRFDESREMIRQSLSFDIPAASRVQIYTATVWDAIYRKDWVEAEQHLGKVFEMVESGAGKWPNDPHPLLSKRSSCRWSLRNESLSTSQKQISRGVVHDVPADFKKALTSDPRALAAWEDITPLARNEWICWIESAKNQKLEAVGSSGAVQALRMENDAPVRWPGCAHR